MARFETAGQRQLTCLGLPPRRALRGLRGGNWPHPPPGTDRVSYVYMNEDDEVLAEITEIAQSRDFRFRTEPVHVDGER